jgi:hypothetical protein
VSDNDHPLVHIRVTVNVNSMRRGQELQVPLTEHIEGLSLAGYIQILGHVHPPVQAAAEPPPGVAASAVAELIEPEPAEAVPTPAKPKRVRSKVVVDDGGSEGSS